MGLDIGTKRIGLAYGDSVSQIAMPITTVITEGCEPGLIKELAREYGVTDFVVGRPRNQQGNETAQTKIVKDYADEFLQGLRMPLHWQDESLTSVIAEERLKARGKPYAKDQIDSEAATIILQDFLDNL